MSDFRQRIENLTPKRLQLLALDLHSKLEENERERTEPIAITGIGCRVPATASSPQGFWDLLASGRNCICVTPGDRWDAAAYFDPNPDTPGRMSTKLGGFLSNVDLFDAPFFSIARREAVSMDPQQRLLLEVCWEALENAGHSPQGLSGSPTGVFVGICSTDYHGMLLARGQAAIDAYLASGTAPSIAAGRVSYALGLQGPSLAVDTACSASLVAVHLACQSLRSRECRMALAGGVNLMLTPDTTIALSKAHMLAADGRCKTFDARADGFVRGEGCGIVVLKRLSDALADGDNILALIRGSAINQDGRSSGLTAPNGAAQEALIRQALASGGVKATEISYVEAHGTGTSLGDPIEAHALAAVLGPQRSPDNPLIVGSVKTNLGHLESAAGVAGLIKVVLALQNQQIPAHLHFQNMNPHIDWGGMPVEIPVQARPWPRGEKRRVAGVSSFGFSGTNAHLIVEEAPAPPERVREMERPLHILALSARNGEALQELRARYVEELKRNPSELADICYTANAGRAHFEHRMAVMGGTVEEVSRKLEARKSGEPVKERGGIRPVFLFSGQGSQYAGMGKQLYETEPVFRKALEECEELLGNEWEERLRDVLWGEATPLLEQTAYTQPALFAVEYALAELWKSWGIEPGAVLGHSVGEYAAACVAGVYGLADGLKLIAARGRLMQGVSGQGAMLAVMAAEPQVRAELAGLEERVSIAALNAPENTVISGYVQEVAMAEERLQAAGVRGERLRVSHGFHSPQMEEMEAAFEEVAGRVAYAVPRVKLLSSVTGQELGRGDIHAGYWRRQVRQPVRFQAAMEGLQQTTGAGVYLEVGPGTTLVSLGRQCMPGGNGTGKPEPLWLVSIRKGRGDWEQLLESLGRLYEHGAKLDWDGFDQGYARRRVPLPTYPFQRQRYWIENAVRRPANLSELAAAQNKFGGAAETDGVGSVPNDWYYKVAWQPKQYRSIPQGPTHSAEQLADSLYRRADELQIEHGFDHYAALRPALNLLCTTYIAEALRSTGWNFQVGVRATTEQLAARCKISERHRMLFGRLLEILAEDGVLSREEEEGDAWIVLRTPVPREPEMEMRKLRERYPEFEAELEMTARCAKSLAGVVQGKVAPLSLLFPGGSTENAERIYRDSPSPRVFSRLVSDVVSAEVLSRTDGIVKVLEIGAGTGGTTVYVAPVMPAERTEYVYTDVSASFKAKAADRFKSYPFFSYQTLDIEKDPAEQGFEQQQFDIIIAANVLHATADLRQTVGRIRNLLSPEGIVVLLEGTYPERWVDLTFGLTEGWWRFRDRDLRPSYPLISRQSWLGLLAELGFSNPNAVQLPGAQQVVFYARTPAATSKPVSCLIVPDSRGVAEEFAAQLKERGGNADFANSAESTTELLRSNSYDLVLHMSALDSPASENLDGEMLAASQSALVPSVLATAQAIALEQSTARLWLITSGAQPVLPGPSVLNLIQSSVWGLGKTFALEHPGSWGGLLDLDPGCDARSSASGLVSAILHRDADAEDQLAFRNNKRYVARLCPCAPPRQANPRFFPEKTYVITGGLGSLGMKVAGWMVDHGARSLVLIGRRTPSRDAEELIEGLRRRGACVEVRAADVASKQEIEAVFREVMRTMPSIGGVVHAAGFLDDGLLEKQTWERIRRVMAPKVVGAWNLHEATMGMELDFFVLFSSMSALTGSAGTSSYAAGNGFMDALAHYRRELLGLPATSVNWGIWEGAGMGERVGGGTRRRAGLRSMSSDLALAALASVLSATDPQIAIGSIDWSTQKPVYEGPRKRPLLEQIPNILTDVCLPEPSADSVEDGYLFDLKSALPKERQDQLIKYLIATVAPILATTPANIDSSRPLTDFGMDSLMALEFKNRINSDLNVSIPTVRFLEGTSLRNVASLIAEKLPFLSSRASIPKQSTLTVRPSVCVQLEELLAIRPKHRRSWLMQYLVGALAPILGVDSASIDSRISITDFGLDSLMALELKNRIASELGVAIPTVRFLEGPNLEDIASQVEAEVSELSPPTSSPSTRAPILEYPLSYTQQQMWFVHKLTPDSATFNVGFTAKASPHLDWRAFEAAVAKLTSRHAALRAIFVETDDGPVQRILSCHTTSTSLIDASGFEEHELREQIVKDFQKNMDLDQPLFRVTVFRRADCDVIYFKVDHLIIDHWSVQLCFEDLKKLYTAEVNGTEAALEPLKAEYRDFVEWESTIGEDPALEQQWNYWKKKLGGDLPTLQLPCSRQRPTALMARGQAIPLAFSPSLAARIWRVARPLKTTEYTFLLAAFQVLLYRYSGQDDLIIGTSASGRENPRWANTVGFFVNLLPIRSSLSGNPTFAEHLARSRDAVLGAIEHQEFPFTLMMTRLKLRRTLERMPVFQAFFNFLTDRSGEFGPLFMGVQGRPVQFGSSVLVPWLTLPLQEGRIELGLQMVEVDGELGGYINYNSDVVDRTTAESMAATYSRLLDAVLLEPNIPIEDLAHDAEEMCSERDEIVL